MKLAARCVRAPCLRTAIDYKEELALRDYLNIQEELEKKWWDGPYEESPFEFTRCFSRVNVPKGDNETRWCSNFSNPWEDSVNSATNVNHLVQYPLCDDRRFGGQSARIAFDIAARNAKRGPAEQLIQGGAKSDLLNGYKIVPAHPRDAWASCLKIRNPFTGAIEHYFGKVKKFWRMWGGGSFCPAGGLSSMDFKRAGPPDRGICG